MSGKKAPAGARRPARALKRLWSYPVKYFRGPLVLFFVFVALAVVCNALGPRILGLATTRILTDVMDIARGAGTRIDLAYIGKVAAALLCLYGAAFVFQYMEGRLMTRITNRSTYHIRNDVVRKLDSLPPSFFEGRSRASVLSHITNDADVVAVTFNQVVTQTANSAFTLVAVAFMMFSMSPLLACVVLALLPASILAALLVSRRSHGRFARLQNDMEDLTASVQDALGARGRRPLRDREEDSFRAANERACEDAREGNATSGSLMPAVNAMSAVVYVAVCVLGAFLVARGSLAVGELQAFIQYVRSFSQPLTQLTWISNSIHGLLAAAENVFEFLDAEETETGSAARADGFDISFENVSFARGRFALKDVSLRVPEGTSVAVTGPPGAGKTTLARLLLGIERPDAGAVLVGGADPRALAGERVFGAAFQTPWLQSETIFENIAYGAPDASPSDARAALRRVGAESLIFSRPGGAQARVAERFSNLSDGEIQLLQAGRLECSNPRVFVLDDAFDAVDALTFRKLLDLFMRGHPGSTKILITGDPSELERADLVVMLKNGRVEAVGRHADLLSSSPAYADFIRGREDPGEED